MSVKIKEIKTGKIAVTVNNSLRFFCLFSKPSKVFNKMKLG